MRKKRIDFDTAQLCWDCGMRTPKTKKIYSADLRRELKNFINSGTIGDYNGSYLPSFNKEDVRDWLRDRKYHIVIIPEFYTTGINYNWQVLIYDPNDEYNCTHRKSSMMYGDNGEYPEYHLALEAGLKKALELYKKIEIVKKL